MILDYYVQSHTETLWIKKRNFNLRKILTWKGFYLIDNSFLSIWAINPTTYFDMLSWLFFPELFGILEVYQIKSWREMIAAISFCLNLSIDLRLEKKSVSCRFEMNWKTSSLKRNGSVAVLVHVRVKRKENPLPLRLNIPASA